LCYLCTRIRLDR